MGVTSDLAERLEVWFSRHARQLPWRQTRDPYSIWISEVMLQQTQVATVIPYYEAFVGRFPTVETLARASEEAVLNAWSGLGYYSRARHLHRAAHFLVEHHTGKFPQNRMELLKIPGIGPYTAGAILSIAFDLPEPLVDGNVERVFARFFGIELEVKSTAAKQLIWEKAQQWVNHAHSPRLFNQALMELGATVCVKGAPRCENCPITQDCVARKKGLEERLPIRAKRKSMVDLWWVTVVFSNYNQLFLQKNSRGVWWSDLWDLPRWNINSREEWIKPVPNCVRYLLRKHSWRGLDLIEHTVTHHRIHVAPFHVLLETKRVPKALTGQWFARRKLSHLPMSSLAKKVLRATI